MEIEPALSYLIQHTPLAYFFDGGQRLFWLYLLSSAVMAVLFLWWQQGRLPDYRSLYRYWWHPEARLDYGYFVVSWVIKVLLLTPLLLSAKTVAWHSYQWFALWLSPLHTTMRYESIVLLYTVTLFVVSDFTRYWLHRWLHRFDFLWRFHRVHHSAEVLNPLTFYRVHPVESFLFGLRYAISTGVVTAVFMACFGARLSVLTVLGSNVFVVAFAFFGSNLRHSSIRLSYGRRLECWLISPAQHQIHHSVHHMNRNYGGYLAVWDWLFGSLCRHHEVQEPLILGLGEGDKKSYDGIIKLMISPFYK